MDCDEEDNSGVPPTPGNDESRSAVNSLILDYYKKFGRKRDLEQYFSLSTAQSDIRDPASSFWTKIKAENESSDSGERSDKKSGSSQELCRISIRCSVQDPCSSQEEESKTKTESTSPPIIIEEVSQGSRQNSEDEALKSDDNNSQKSYDVLLDTSMNKALSPSSSITSQRKLEWDSLADVGYGNESDRKTSASSLSTLERLALKQQYSNNDTQDNIVPPTAHSTPIEDNETRSKTKKGIGKKSTKIYKKDVDFLEVNVPHSSNTNPAQSINVNLTKHISFNVEKDGKVTVDNVQKDVTISPEKVSVNTEVTPRVRIDKEIQTSLLKTKDFNALFKIPEDVPYASQKIPIVISLNTLRKHTRRKQLRMARRKLKMKKKVSKDNVVVLEKSGDQLSEAESFEYMPGHMYNQNQLNTAEGPSNVAGNKSSLESSGAVTTDSSKGSKHSFSKDLEKSIDILKAALQNRCDDNNLKKKLIKQVCQRLLRSEYRDDDSGTEFLSGLSFSSKKLDLGEKSHTTTSTSDANNSAAKPKRPKKSILRSDKFNPGTIASTSQSAPNLPVASNSEKLVTSNLSKSYALSNTDSDMSSKEKTSSDNVCAKTSSKELYQKYLQAVKREEAYKRHLKDKEIFLKQKLVCSDNALTVPLRVDVKTNNRLKDLINDLTRNNYDDGSGDASKLEGGSSSNFERLIPNRSQRSHSVFTLSSGNSDYQNKKSNIKKRLQCDINDLSKPGPSKDSHYCCCPHHSSNMKSGVTDSSVQVNIKSPCTDDTCIIKQKMRIAPIQTQRTVSPNRDNLVTADSRNTAGGIKYVCMCKNKAVHNIPDNVLVYKYTSLHSDLQGDTVKESNTKIHCASQTNKEIENLPSTSKKPYNENQATVSSSASLIGPNMHPQIKMSKSSQTNMLLRMFQGSSSTQNLLYDDKISSQFENDGEVETMPSKGLCAIYEATRCTQTEISINPRIAEPSLSDINIVSESDRVKLISEHCRMPVKTITDIYLHNDAETCTCTGSIKSSGTSKRNDNELMDSDFQVTEVLDKTNTGNQRLTRNIGKSGNFTIPIQGTNMTLMVSIGSENKSNKIAEKATVSEAIETDKISITEQATCMTEDNSKEILSGIDIIDHNSNEICDDITNKRKMSETVKVACTEKICLTKPKCDTYPNHSLCSDPKHLPRSLSTFNIDKGCDAQRDLFIKRDAETQENVPISTQTSYHKKCKCGCSKPEDKCNNKCIYYKNVSYPSSTRPCTKSDTCHEYRIQNVTVSKENETFTPENQTDKATRGQIRQQSADLPETNTFPDTQSVKSRSCEDTKHKCTENYIERITSPKASCKKQSQDKNSLANVCFSDNESSERQCSSGCGGAKDNCLKNLRQLSLKRDESPAASNRKQSIDISTCANIDFTGQNEKCSCGCGGTKDNCRKNCIECNALPEASYRKQSKDKSSCANIDFSNHKEKCSCGCGGTKDNCHKTCNKRCTSPRTICKEQSPRRKSCATVEFFDSQTEKCSCGCEASKNNCQKKCFERSTLPIRRNQSPGKKSSASVESDNRNEKCSCGCGSNKINCSKKCTERNVSPKKQNRKRSPDRPQRTLTNYSVRLTEKCPCGCGGTKDNCRKDCIEYNASPRDERNKLSSTDKDACTRKDISDNQKDKCSCGCNGTKDNCRKDCIEINASPREQIRKQSIDKQVCTQKELTDNQKEKCSCGCDGTKGNCRKDCIELNVSPRVKCNKRLEEKSNAKSQDLSHEKCPCGCGGDFDSCKEDCRGLSELCKKETMGKKEVGTQKNLSSNERSSMSDSRESQTKKLSYTAQNSTETKDKIKCTQNTQLVESDKDFTVPQVDSRGEQTNILNSDKAKKITTSESEQTDSSSDPILKLIQDITKRYTKKDAERNKRKKCFTEIMVALNYLLETDDCIEPKGKKCISSSAADDSDSTKVPVKSKPETPSKRLVDKAVQLPTKKSKSRNCITESSEIPTSTDIPGTSSDSTTCKVLKRIKKECEKYHQRRCKMHSGNKCDLSSSTSINCDQCRRIHHCPCRSHKCKVHKKSAEKNPKGPVAYNLILQTSESMISDGAACEKKCSQLQSIVVKVPKKKPMENVPFKEMAMKFEKKMESSNLRNVKPFRSRSLPNESEISSMDDIIRRSQGCTVREYLEKNRPDFVQRCSQRQNCLKYINESRKEDPCAPPNLKMVVVHTSDCMDSANKCFRGVPMTFMCNQYCEPSVITLQNGVARIANQRAVHRDLLSLHVAQLPDVTNLNADELRRLAKDLGRHMRTKQPAPKFISEREMKKHSEKIYKSLPEEVKKRDERKKENIKKTNLLMASIFKKNLQKKTLRGSVNLSNYSTVIKI